MEDIKNYKSIKKIETVLFKTGKRDNSSQKKIPNGHYTNKTVLNLIRNEETNKSHNAKPLLTQPLGITKQNKNKENSTITDITKCWQECAMLCEYKLAREF